MTIILLQNQKLYDLIDINDVYESKQKVIRMYVYVWVLSPMWFI